MTTSQLSQQSREDEERGRFLREISAAGLETKHGEDRFGAYSFWFGECRGLGKTLLEAFDNLREKMK